MVNKDFQMLCALSVVNYSTLDCNFKNTCFVINGRLPQQAITTHYYYYHGLCNMDYMVYVVD